MRLLIIAGLIYLGYRALKSWLIQVSPPPRSVENTRTTEIDDVMLKDPVCHVYFAKKNGVHQKINGKDFYFCSTECRDRFKDQHSQ
jgi:YHS domain-containing protein